MGALIKDGVPPPWPPEPWPPEPWPPGGTPPMGWPPGTWPPSGGGVTWPGDPVPPPPPPPPVPVPPPPSPPPPIPPRPPVNADRTVAGCIARSSKVPIVSELLPIGGDSTAQLAAAVNHACMSILPTPFSVNMVRAGLLQPGWYGAFQINYWP